ncbi:NAD(P)/FAD-dependent oxidoreductase [Orenia marismortui]|uniref:Protoporphyrinogen oxidase n=1 Tax=Orenia marismortui TaxID=46469 RepID=A0A4V3H037_9FIRM|nr:NAD(P)/FAD-dependent oxidoreductase [Orenia marismortui]TDX59259.1 protoporphyrinogen oxidase [Orenia marismortui]
MVKDKIAIVGGGLTGLTAGYELVKQGYEVTIFEQERKIGGLASVFDFEGTKLDKYYRHIFMSDKYVVDLCKELDIYDKIMWLSSKMGTYSEGTIYPFGNPIDLLKFKPLSFIDKIKFGLTTLYLQNVNKEKEYEKITAEEWMLKYAGEKVFNKIWKPLLTSKFGSRYNEIAMVWLWNKIFLRGKSKDSQAANEKLGYMEGSFGVLLDKLVSVIEEKGGRIHLNSKVKDILREKNGLNLSTEKNQYKFDRIIFTGSHDSFLDIAHKLSLNYKDMAKNLEYTGTRCMILKLKEALSDIYWMNITDQSFPFGGIIEHTNFISKEQYNGNHIVYISNYLYPQDKLYNISSKELLNIYIPYLKKINPNFDKDWIIDYYDNKSRFAQPMIVKNYSEFRPGFKTSIEGLYVANMFNIYPEDRGVNYAIRLGKDIAKKLLEE